MIRHIGNRNVPCPKEVSDEASYHPDAKQLARPDKKDCLFLEVFPVTPKEIAFYGSINKRYRCHAACSSHMGQSPLLVQMSEARRLGII